MQLQYALQMIPLAQVVRDVCRLFPALNIKGIFMKLNSFLSSMGLALVGTAVASASAFAAEPLNNLYVGGGLSFNSATGLGAKIDSADGKQGLGSSSTADQRSNNPNLHLGYQLNPNFAIEGSYDRVGKMNVNSSITTPSPDTATGAWKANGVGLSVVGKLPIDTQWSVFGRLGVEQWRTSLNLASNSGGATNVGFTSTTTGLLAGAGAAYALSQRVDATAEFVHYDRVGSNRTTGQIGLNAVHVGLNYHFM